MARAVIRVPRVDTQNGNNNSTNNNGNTKPRSSLTSPKAQLAREQSDNAVGNAVVFDLPMENREAQHARGQYTHQASGFNKVPSLMFDMEDTHDEKELQWMNGSYEDTMPSEASLNRLAALVETQDEDEEMLAMHVNYALNDALERRGTEMGTEELGERLRALGYTVTLRTALGGDSIGGNASCLRNLRHSFLAVSLPNSPDGTAIGRTGRDKDKVFIVDPKFLDQFEIAHSTCRYDALLSVLPAAIVVPVGRLTDAVGILCEEMARAFERTGTPVPPWRQTSAMLSKWQPRRSEDVTMTHHHRTPGSGGKAQKQDCPLSTIVEKRYGPGARVADASQQTVQVRAPASKDGFGQRYGLSFDHGATRQGGGNFNSSHEPSRRTSRQTTPDQADLEAFYSSDDMATDGKTIWPGYTLRDSNNLVSEYVSLSI